MTVLRTYIILGACLLGLYPAGIVRAQTVPDAEDAGETDAPSSDESDPVSTETAETQPPSEPTADADVEGTAAPQESDTESEREQETTPAAPPESEAAPASEATEATEANSEAQEAFAAQDVVSDAEVAQFLSEEASDEPRLDVYGFADFGLVHTLLDDDSFWHAAIDRNSSFFIGNANLYLDAHLSEAARSLIEVRFLYQPQNNVTPEDPDEERIGYAPDHADRNRPLKWGGVEIERAWVEYNLHNLLTVRAGQWLTPYGIWNVDHGSPTVISANRPFIVGNGLMPERQTGLQLYGSTSLGSSLRGGYHLTVSNGRGPLDAFRDLDDNKAVGGRLFLNLNEAGRWKLGGSAYYGRTTDAVYEYEITDENTVIVPATIRRQYDELVLSADLQWDLGAFHFQSEIIHNQRAYTKDGRAAGPNILDSGFVGEGVPPDLTTWGTYALAGYRLPWLNLMPYVYGEYYSWNGALDVMVAMVGGLNWQPIPSLVVKGQYMHAMPVGEDEVEFLERIPDFKALQFQVAWAF